MLGRDLLDGVLPICRHSLAQDDLDRYVPWHRRYAWLAWFTQDVASHVSGLVHLGSLNLGHAMRVG